MGTSPGRSLLYSSIRPSDSDFALSFSMVFSIIWSPSNRSRIALSEPYPMARRSVVAQIFLFLSTCTQRTPCASCSNSSHAPREGITVVANISLPVLSRELALYTPGERTSCDTTTRSAPLMMNDPESVMRGISPMKTSCSLISPVTLFIRRARTCIALAYVASRERHSFTSYLGFSSNQ